MQNKSNDGANKKGLVICYIGAGKGKTSAAMGLAARASGAGLAVYILQFVKARAFKASGGGKNGAKAGGGDKTGINGEAQPKIAAAYPDRRQNGEWPLSHEIDFFNAVSIPGRLGQIQTEQAGLGFVGILGDKKQRETHIKEALRGLERARRLIISKKYDLIILDEIISAVELKLLTPSDVADIIKLKPPDLHLAITGHNKFPEILKLCDLVTEMKMIKHPYYQGILAQEGIDY